MKEAFVHKRFGDDALDMIRKINGILDEYVEAGYDLSLRQLYYQLVSRNIVPNTERSYKNVGNLVSDARLAGFIDWDIIKDRGREMMQNPHWDNPREIIRACAQQYREDLWTCQPNYVEVMVEKQALEGVLMPVCQQWDVPFTANKGYSSSSAMYEASKRILRRVRNGKEATIIYLGDHDPSGIDMSRDVLDRLELFVGSKLHVYRVALNMDQVRKLNPPENPAKLTDSRASAYIEQFGMSSWELDAIEPKALAKLVHDAIKSLVDLKQRKIDEQKQQEGRDWLTEIADREE